MKIHLPACVRGDERRQANGGWGGGFAKAKPWLMSCRTLPSKVTPEMTGRPGCQTMEMNGGSSPLYLACTPCVPLVYLRPVIVDIDAAQNHIFIVPFEPHSLYEEGEASSEPLQWGRSSLVDPAECPKIHLLNRDFGNILWIFPGKTATKQSSLNLLQSGPRKFTKSDFSGLAPIQ